MTRQIDVFNRKFLLHFVMQCIGAVVFALSTGHALAAVNLETKLTKEHLSPILGCMMRGYMYQAAYDLTNLGGPRNEVEKTIAAYKHPDQTQEDIRQYAKKVLDYVENNRTADGSRVAGEMASNCMTSQDLPVSKQAADGCWAVVLIGDKVMAERRAGVTKEQMLARLTDAINMDSRRKAGLSNQIEKVYAWEQDDVSFSFTQYLSCLRAFEAATQSTK